jgi:hypothetical protein
MPTDTITRARALIQTRLAELEAEAKKLEGALASMGQGAAGRPRGGAKPAPAKRRSKGARAPRGQRRDELLAAVKASPGARPSELARQLGISANQAHGLIAKARKDKQLVKKGKGYALKP